MHSTWSMGGFLNAYMHVLRTCLGELFEVSIWKHLEIIVWLVCFLQCLTSIISQSSDHSLLLFIALHTWKYVMCFSHWESHFESRAKLKSIWFFLSNKRDEGSKLWHFLTRMASNNYFLIKLDLHCVPCCHCIPYWEREINMHGENVSRILHF